MNENEFIKRFIRTWDELATSSKKKSILTSVQEFKVGGKEYLIIDNKLFQEARMLLSKTARKMFRDYGLKRL